MRPKANIRWSSLLVVVGATLPLEGNYFAENYPLLAPAQFLASFIGEHEDEPDFMYEKFRAWDGLIALLVEPLVQI